MSICKVLKVLIVDDHVTSRMITVEGFRAMGIENIDVAKDGREAYAKLLSNPVHLVVTDLYMPDVDGYQLLKAIRSHPSVNKTGVIMLTGKKDEKVVANAKMLGVNNVLAKPFTAFSLQHAVESVVGRLN